MSRAINLNADLGESFGPWPMGSDDELLAVVRSANIACGFHAGDPLVMRRTVRAAGANGVSLGAHPGFPDLQGFGRRQMKVPADELAAMLIYQIGALAGMHVNPDGKAISNAEWEARKNDWQATPEDRAFVAIDQRHERH